MLTVSTTVFAKSTMFIFNYYSLQANLHGTYQNQLFQSASQKGNKVHSNCTVLRRDSFKSRLKTHFYRRAFPDFI